MVKETIEYREKNDVKRNDFMSLLVQLKQKGIIEDIDDKNAKGSYFIRNLRIILKNSYWKIFKAWHFIFAMEQYGARFNFKEK